MNVIELAQKLAQFESTHEKPENMQACLDFCINFFSGTSAVVTKYEQSGVPSVVISNHSDLSPDVMLLGHIDTVPGTKEQFAGTITDGKLYGRGTLDMKAFVATSMMVMKNVLKSDTNQKVSLTIVTDEELGGVHGARYLVEEVGYRPQVVLVPDDGEDLDVIVSETKHIFQIQFTAEGTEAHANQPWKGENAILKLLSTYQNIETALNVPKQTPSDSFVDTCNLGMISGGVASNEVPGHAEMTVDVRLVSMNKAQLCELIEQNLDSGVTYKITLEGFPTKLNTETPIVKKYIETIEKVIGKSVRFKRAGGATDARYFSAVGTIPIVHQSHGRNAQALDEYVAVNELETLVDIQTKFILS